MTRACVRPRRTPHVASVRWVGTAAARVYAAAMRAANQSAVFRVYFLRGGRARVPVTVSRRPCSAYITALEMMLPRKTQPGRVCGVCAWDVSEREECEERE